MEPLLLALSLLTLVTGLVDAACYLGLGRVFTANMTGNVVLLAFGATGAQGLPVLAPTVSLVVFLVGAAGGGRLASRLVGPAGAEVPAPLRRPPLHRRPRPPGRHHRPAAHRDSCPRRLAGSHDRLDDPVGPPVEALVQAGCVL